MKIQIHAKQSRWLKGKHWVKQHLMGTVIFFLFVTWVGIAEGVFYFEDGVKDANIHSLQDSLWWGIVTFLTVGYGDRYPVTLPGRLLRLFFDGRRRGHD